MSFFQATARFQAPETDAGHYTENGVPEARTGISFEFFPPKTEAGAEKLLQAIGDLAQWNPHHVTITCGAGGSAVDGTYEVVSTIRKKFDLAVAPHIAFSRLSRARIEQVLGEYRKLGIKRIVAIRGDAVESGDPAPADAYENTVDFVADLHGKYGFDVAVGAYPDVHPMAQSPQQDLDHLKRKVEAGAIIAISQFFFEPATFLRFRDKVAAAGIKVALVPGIMPVHNIEQITRFAKGCGTLVPAGFGARFEKHGGDEKALFGESVAHATELCEVLDREGVNDFHFYALNKSELVSAICEKLAPDKDKQQVQP
ncbi:MAG: methylenetetrahydrofolate reductase [NAD(P)H] [Alphaproteobacteria bacterium]|nr:methylenetetrahydrofolate reductase [NAD(P)H] [Alphaproteobacteria bacterium]